jgi:hypothetical protein
VPVASKSLLDGADRSALDDAYGPPLDEARRALDEAQPVLPHPKRSQRLVSLLFESDEESADVRIALVLRGIQRLIQRRVQATGEEIGQERAIQ